MEVNNTASAEAAAPANMNADYHVDNNNEVEDSGDDQQTDEVEETEQDRIYFAGLATEVARATESGRQHDRYLIICNISKYHNVRVLIHTALAFGFVPVLVGCPQVEKKLTEDKKMLRSSSFIHYQSFEELLAFLGENSISLIGIEIGHGAQSVLTNNLFTKTHIAFMLGNEGSGLARQQREACQGLVYIPQYGNGTASLNVSSASAVILNCYYKWSLII
jgi:tRNA G18 (ribose-2'-O)-methylase SpoU